MNDRAGVSSYARALLDVAERESDPERVSSELDAYVNVVKAHLDLSRVLLNPVVPPQRKAQAVHEIAARAGLSPVVAKLLVVLAQRDRLALVPDLSDAFRARVLERRNIVSAEVTTAVPLTPQASEALAHRLGEVTGKHVRISRRVDPSIIGGVVAQIGSTVYDGSVKGQLARMRQKLVENA
jgi:F-type H+-transporting ATPase subunit delta